MIDARDYDFLVIGIVYLILGVMWWRAERAFKKAGKPNE